MKLLLLACHLFLVAALKFNEAPPTSNAANADAVGPVKTTVEAEVAQLIQRIQEADREGVKQLLAKLVHTGGQKHLEAVLEKFAARGYDYNQLLQWLAGAWEQAGPRAAPESKMVDEHGFKLLLEGLKSSNKTTVRDAFSEMLRGGGPAFLRKKLEELEHMGYVIDDIKQWYASKDDRNTSPPKTPSDDAQELIKFLKSRDQGALRMKLTELFHHGGEAHLHAALQALSAAGFDPKEVERLAAGQMHKVEPAKASTGAPDPDAPSRSATSDPSASDEALALLKSIAENDRKSAQKELAAILAKGGDLEVKEVLRRAEFPGHDAKQIQAWIAEEPGVRVFDPAPGEPVPKTAVPTAAVDSAAPGSSGPSSGGTVVAAMPSVATTSSTVAPTTPPMSQAVSSEVFRPPDADAEFLVLRLRDGDRRGAADAMVQMFAQGGQRRIQRALAGLKLWGYDPSRFQQWVAEGVPGLLVGTPTERENTVMAMADALKKWDRRKASQLLNQIFQKGGPSKVTEVLQDLKSMGYSPSEVERWIYAKSPVATTPAARTGPAAPAATAVTALALEPKASKVKLLNVQDFRIAVSDLSTAQLHGGSADPAAA